MGSHPDFSLNARVLLTGIARVVASVRQGSTCDNWDTLASRAAVTITFLPAFDAQFKIGCEPITVFGISLTELGNALKGAGEKIANVMTEIGEAVGAELEKFGEGFVNTITGRLSTSQQNVLRKLYHIRHMNCKANCPNGFHHFATSDKGCCKHLFSCGGNRKWCRKKKTFSEVGRRELGEDEPEAEVGIFDTFKDELALMKSLNGLSDSETEEFVASFDEDELAQAPDMERMSADEEQEVADEKREWIQVHNNMEEMSAEEQEEKVGEILKVLEKKFWRRSDIKV